MDWSVSTWWWIAVGVLLAAEMATNTVYLLMFALGLAAAALAAHAGLSLTAQIVIAALVGTAAALFWHLRRRRQAPPGGPGASRALNLDIGERVEVAAWQPDGSTHVQYRGASWTARYADEGAPQPGPHVIRAIDGSCLMLGR